MQEEYVCMPDFEIRKDETYQQIETLLTDTLESAAYELLRFSEIDLKGNPEPVVQDVLQQMILEGKVVRLGDDMVTMKHYVDEARERIEAHFAQNDLLTFVQVRDMFATSRKCAKILVEYMDELKVTKKLGAETERVACR